MQLPFFRCRSQRTAFSDFPCSQRSPCAFAFSSPITHFFNSSINSPQNTAPLRNDFMFVHCQSHVKYNPYANAISAILPECFFKNFFIVKCPFRVLKSRCLEKRLSPPFSTTDLSISVYAFCLCVCASWKVFPFSL